MTTSLVILGVAVWVNLAISLVVVGVDAKPQQPINPIIGLVSEPVAHSGCVSMYEEERMRVPSVDSVRRRHDPSPFAKLFAANSQQATPITTDLRNHTLPPIPGPSGCIWSLYVDWLEASGIRVLPIPWDASPEKLDYILHRVNGVLLAGGDLGWVPSLHAKFFKVAQKIYKYTIDQNAKGDPFVLWGTCQGFEMLTSAAAGSFSVVKTGFYGMEPLMMAVNFTEWATESQLFGSSSAAQSVSGQRVKSYLTSELTTLNWHSYGVPPGEFLNPNTNLNASGLRPLSTTNDPVTGRTFTSSVESIKGPIFGVQFHPERVMFELDNQKITHQDHAIEVSEYLGNFLVEQLRGNNHTFESFRDADALLIANYPRFNLWGHSGIRVYNV